MRLAIFRLYEEIGLFDDLKVKNYTVKSLKNSFGISGRLDSEYYQEKYDRLFEILNISETKNLTKIADLKRGEFVSDTIYGTGNIDYIRGTNITKHIVDDECVKIDLDINNYKSVKKNEIIFSMIGSVGEVAIYTKDKNAIISNNLGSMSIVDDNVNSYYLFSVLNSIVGKMQFEKYQMRTAQPKISLEDIANFIIPIIKKEKQEEIKNLLLESINLRIQSKNILDKAVKAVEIAIDENESKALDFLKI